MAQTRGATGNAKPRVLTNPSTESTRKTKTATTKKPKVAGTTTKKSVTGAGVKKRGAKPTIKDKVEGVVDKVEGAVERKPGKKAAGTKKVKGETGTKKTAKVA